MDSIGDHYARNLDEEKLRRYRTTRGRKFQTEGFINANNEHKPFNAMIFFEENTEIKVNKIGINKYHSDLFEGIVVGSDLLIIASFKEVRPINTKSIKGLDYESD